MQKSFPSLPRKIFPLSVLFDVKDKNKTLEREQKEHKKAIPISFQYRAMSSAAAFTHKLHLIYLINDLLHYWLVDLHLLLRV